MQQAHPRHRPADGVERRLAAPRGREQGHHRAPEQRREPGAHRLGEAPFQVQFGPGEEAEARGFDRRLDAAPLNEVLRLDDGEHFDETVGLDRAPRREPEGDARLLAIVDDDEIGTFRVVCSHDEQVLR